MLIICDLDGTLIDSAPRHLAVLNDILFERGKPLVDERYLAFKREGRSTRNYLREQNIGTPEEQEAISLEWAARIEEEKYLRLDTWIESRCHRVEMYHQEGARIMILSARKDRLWIEETIRSRFPWLSNQDVYIVDPLHAAKAKAQVLKSLPGGSPALLLGDTEADYESTLGTRVIPWMLNTGFRSRAYWERQGVPSHSDFPSVEEMVNLVQCSMGNDHRKEISMP